MKKDWEMKKMGELADLSRGHNPPKSQFSTVPKEGYVRFYQIRDGWSDEYKVYVPDSPKLHKVKQEDILMVAYRHIGRVFRGVEGAFNVALCKITNARKDLLDDEYLFNIIESTYVKGELLKRSERSLIPSMSIEHFKEILVPLPPLREQQRIVSLIEQAFEAIDKAKENAEKNLQNATEIFESYLHSVFANPGDDWEEKELGDIGNITSSKRIFKNEYTQTGVPFYRTKEIKELANKKSITTELFISEERYQEIKGRHGIPVGGDILLTAIGTIGEVYVVEQNEKFYFKDGNVLWLKNFNSLNPYYLKFALVFFIEQIKRLSIGSAYNALPIQKLKEYKIPIPSINEQTIVVEKLNTIQFEIKKLESIYQQKLTNLDELKKSILKKAFDGEL